MFKKILNKKIITAVIAGIIISLSAIATHADDTQIGDIQIMVGNYAPMGWMLCNGQQLQITQNVALFSLIGNFYGGDGMRTFNLPNLAAWEPGPNMHYYIAVEGYYPQRK